MSTAERLDILIVGAGLSGIGTAHHLKSAHPDRSFAILESRPQIGGTWDLFRYPGIRSDSDMHTLGYRFRPWTAAKSIADGASILDYIRSTATESGIDAHIRFGHRVVAADWSAATSTWRVKVIAGETTRFFECSFLVMCSGYYSYDAGYTPELKGIDTFEGRVVHPQQWPEDLDHSGRDIVVIGSGATAVTLVPALAKSAAHVTMLQRSPTYIMSVPSQDVIANTLRRLVGSQLSYRLTRWKNVATAWAVYELSRRCPSIIKAMVRKNVAEHLPAADVDAHFTPSYQPWDQRLCAAPDGDLFRSLKSGRASVVTDTIDTFTDVGIRLTSGTTLRADIVVTATGLDLLFFGGIDLRVNGNRVNVAEAFAYKGMMLSDVPNFVYTLGYTNSSWTLKADLVSQYLCRLIDFMDSHGYTSCVPHPDDLTMPRRPLFDFEAGYVKRALDRMPSSGPRAPWRQGMNYIEDVITMRHRAIDDGVLQFHRTEHAQPGQDPSTAENHRPDPSHCETGGHVVREYSSRDEIHSETPQRGASPLSRHRADTWKRPAWDVAEDMESPASILDCPPHHGLRAAAASKNSEVIDTIEAHNVWCPSAFNPHELGHQLGVRVIPSTATAAGGRCHRPGSCHRATRSTAVVRTAYCKAPSTCKGELK